MSDFDDFTKAVIDGVKDIATGEFSGFAKQIKADTQDFLAESKDKLKKWLQLLADGAIDEEEFGLLVKGRKDLAVMSALTAAGVAQARIGRVKNKIVDLVIDKGIDLIL
jgi:hypothetical protein